MKSFTLIAILVVSLSIDKTYSQNFTVIDTLPDGAYGTAAWGDFDGDGFKDLAYITQALPDAICKIYHNVGNVFTEVAQQFPLLYNAGAKWADLNNDGFDDLVVNGMDSVLENRTFIYQSLGNGSFISMPNTVFPLSAGAVDIADYNNDGLKDIAVAGFDSVGINHAYIYKNLGAFNFADINASLFGIHFGELKWGDYNHDSLPDLVINGIGNTDFRTRVYKNMGADSFLLQPFYMKGSGGTVDWADLDNDGWLDILVTGYDSTSGANFTELHHNNTNGTFSIVTTNLPDFGEPSGVAIADYNLDGSKDVCFIGGNGVFSFTASAMAINTGINSYNVQPFFQGNVINPIIRTADMDNDGDYDLIFGNLILRNDFVSTGVHDLPFEKPDVTIYPNPADDKIVIKSSAIIKSISVCDISGKEIKSFTDFSAYEILLDNFDASVYFLKIKHTDDKVSFRKLVVIH